jgi:hypothetical protein
MIVSALIQLLSLWTKYTVAGMFYLFKVPPLASFFCLAIPGSFIVTMFFFLPVYALVAPAIGFSVEYQGIVPRLWSDGVFYLMILLVPIVCLARDFVWK